MSVTQGESGARVNFNFIYGTGSQYWSQSARNALQTTAILLSSYFVVDAPVTVTYDVTGEYSPLTSTLATAGSDLVSTDPGFYQTVVQNKILNGVDSNGAAADGVITWNFGNAWAFGNSVSNSQYDFQSTAMHELLHTFGFLSNVDSAGSNSGDNWTYSTASSSRATVRRHRERLQLEDGVQLQPDRKQRWSVLRWPERGGAYGGLVPLTRRTRGSREARCHISTTRHSPATTSN